MQVQLDGVMLYVPDVPLLNKCRDWYLGLGLPRNDERSGHSIFFGVGTDVFLSIHIAEDAQRGNQGKAAAVYLGVADVDAAYRELVAKGYVFKTAPRDRPWGREAGMVDPMENEVYIGSRLKAPATG